MLNCIIFEFRLNFVSVLVANFCRKKFRTLRERFTRELRKSYLEPNTTVKYEYFKELSFLSPYIKFRSISFESADGKTIVTKREEMSIDEKDPTADEMKLLDQEAYYSEEPDQHSYLESGGTQLVYETSAIEQIPEFSGTSQAHDNVSQSDEDNPILLKQKDRKQKINDWDDLVEGNEDKFFAMGIACSLKKLSTINNLKAKVEIYQVLAKFSSKQDLESK